MCFLRLVEFHDISTLVGYLMPNPAYIYIYIYIYICVCVCVCVVSWLVYQTLLVM